MLFGEEFSDRRFNGAICQVLDISQALCAINSNKVLQMVSLTARNICIALNIDSLNLAAVFDYRTEYGEVCILHSVSHVHQLHAKAQVGLVAAITVHSVIPGQALERNLNFLAQCALEDVVNEAFHQFQNFIHIHEGHFHIQLGEFGLTVSTQVLVAEAASDLEITLHASNHQKLLEDLRGLRQRIEFAGVYTAGNQIVACALRSGFAQHRGFNFQETMLVQIVAHQLSNLMTQNQIALHFRTTQVQITEFQAQVFIGIDVIFNIERRSFSLVQYFDFASQYFDGTGSNIFVDGISIAQANLALNLDYEFVTDILSSFEAGACGFRVSNYLHNTATVAQIDKNQSAVVTTLRNPTAQDNLVTGLVFAQLTTMMAAFFINHVLAPLLINYKVLK